jgi:hypothetical protein
VASSTPTFCATTPSGRSLSNSNPRGEEPAYIITGVWWKLLDDISNMLPLMLIQTSPSLHHPKYIPSSANTNTGPAPTGADALLHEIDTDQESMYNGRSGKRCTEGFQNGSCKSKTIREAAPGTEAGSPGIGSMATPTEPTLHCIASVRANSYSLVQFQFRMNALEGNIPGVKKASW